MEGARVAYLMLNGLWESWGAVLGLQRWHRQIISHKLSQKNNLSVWTGCSFFTGIVTFCY